MILNSPEVKRIVDDYDIVFESGMMLNVTLDFSLGDEIHFTDSQILITMASKPSKSDPTKLTTAEDNTVFLRHVASIVHRKREVLELNPEQKHELAKTWLDMTTHPTVQ